MRKSFDEQVAKDLMYYQYLNGLWGDENISFMPCSPKILVGVYDNIQVSTITGDQQEVSRTVKGTTLTLSQEGENIWGLVNRKGLGLGLDGNFEFKENITDFRVIDYDLKAGEAFDETPTGNLHVFGDCITCTRWY